MEVIMYDLNVLIFDINKTAEDEEQVKTLNNLLSLFGGKAEIKNTFDRNQLVLSYDEEKLKKWTHTIKNGTATRIHNSSKMIILIYLKHRMLLFTIVAHSLPNIYIHKSRACI